MLICIFILLVFNYKVVVLCLKVLKGGDVYGEFY